MDGQNKKAFSLITLILIVIATPGCIEDTDGSSYCGEGTKWDSDAEKCIIGKTPILLFEGNYSTVTMQIIHANSTTEANLTYTITIELYHEDAPYHADNFRKHAEAGMYDDVTFHRVIDDFMIQGGDFENNDGTGGHAAQWYGYCDGDSMNSADDCSSETLYTLPDEAENGLRHLPCMVSMAKTSSPNTGGSQFFIMPDDITEHTWLNEVHTVFGKVISGCEHITTLSEAETVHPDRPVVPIIITGTTVSNE